MNEHLKTLNRSCLNGLTPSWTWPRHLPPGASIFYKVPGTDWTLRGFLACGKTYSAHPIDVLDRCGHPWPLPSLGGLIASSHSAFAWQIDSKRSLLTVPIADNEIQRWAKEYIRP
jgi:hypothetical protein